MEHEVFFGSSLNLIDLYNDIDNFSLVSDNNMLLVIIHIAVAILFFISSY